MGRAFTPEPAVDLAAPALRTRCCGGMTDRGENHDPESGNHMLTKEVRLENRLRFASEIVRDSGSR